MEMALVLFLQLVQPQCSAFKAYLNGISIFSNASSLSIHCGALFSPINIDTSGNEAFGTGFFSVNNASIFSTGGTTGYIPIG